MSMKTVRQKIEKVLNNATNYGYRHYDKTVDDLIGNKKVHVSNPQDTETFTKEFTAPEDIKNKAAKDALKEIKDKLS